MTETEITEVLKPSDPISPTIADEYVEQVNTQNLSSNSNDELTTYQSGSGILRPNVAVTYLPTISSQIKLLQDSFQVKSSAICLSIKKPIERPITQTMEEESLSPYNRVSPPCTKESPSIPLTQKEIKGVLKKIRRIALNLVEPKIRVYKPNKGRKVRTEERNRKIIYLRKFKHDKKVLEYKTAIKEDNYRTLINTCIFIFDRK